MLSMTLTIDACRRVATIQTLCLYWHPEHLPSKPKLTLDAGSFPPNSQLAEAYLASLAQLQDGHAWVESVEGCDHLLAHWGNCGIDHWLRPGDACRPRGGRSRRSWYPWREAEEHCLRTRDCDLDQAIINRLPDCIAQCGMGELLPVLSPFACREELTSIMVDSPYEMQDQHPCET